MPSARDHDEIAYHGLNARQQAFVNEYVRLGGKLGCGAKAAAVAGYMAPNQSAYDLVRTPKIRAAIRWIVQAEGLDGAMAGLTYLVEAARGLNEAPHQVRLAAAKDLVDRWNLAARLPPIQRTEHKIEITDTRSDAELMVTLKVLEEKLKSLGVSPPPLALPAPVDIEFEEISDND
jgi:hypothetical protein